MKGTFNLTQPQRLASLVIDLIVVAIACGYLFGTFYPPLGDKGFWGYSALLAVLVGSKLVTPFYVKPADAISYSVPAFISLMLINDWTQWSINQKWGFSLAAGFSLLIFILGITNIISNAVNADWARNLSNRIRVSLEYLGLPQFIYTPLILFAIFSYHLDSALEVAIISIVIGATVWWSLGDFLIGVFYKIRNSFFDKTLAGVAGQIVAFQEPGIVLLRQKYHGDINKHDLLLVHDKHGPAKLVVALDYVGRSEGILVRTVDIKSLSQESQTMIGNVPFSESAYSIDKDVLKDICTKEGIEIAEQSSIVGLVAQDTSIERLYFEVVENKELEEGRLVSVYVGDHKVLYQIVGGLTKEEVVQQKNTFGYLRGQAQQIGIWDEEKEKFRQCAWLPNINEPVYLESKSEYQIQVDSVGHFPQSNYQAKISNIHELVTHNTAILGILGVGKSMLAIELVERLIENNIKVICLDLTNQYANELIDFYDAGYEEASLLKIQSASEQDREEFDNNPEQGGSLPNLSQAIYADLAEFLDPDNPIKLKIYNPSSFVATKQKSEPKSYQDSSGWHRAAGLFSVTPVEITQIISEASLEILSDEMSTTARACLVYEEAHSLVPEWNSVVNEGDKNATSGTARAILQGRKYGLGCMLITQRTANVTKTILNQCNTVFAMRTFDETGKNFLANYVGRDYASALSSIPERHAVFFGKASSCENPVLIRLNDQDQFRTIFRATHPPAELPDVASNTEEAVQADDGFNDEIPF
ncbi:MAG: hypothetical protein DRR42_19055 [Gammaproteobacteria bacterium]|nr:MAG: hypothetical protein DRR42_19055 [Gammaproteobacteria bacterium]